MENSRSAVEELLDREIAQLMELKRIAKDERMLSIMRMIVEASSASADAADSGKGQSHPKAQQVAPRKSAQFSPNGLTDLATSVMRAAEAPFTVSSLVAEMRNKGFVFTAKDANVAVGAVVRRHLAKGKVTLVERGSGSEPNAYAWAADNLASSA